VCVCVCVCVFAGCGVLIAWKRTIGERPRWGGFVFGFLFFFFFVCRLALTRAFQVEK
jgi:hypothetical protein